MYAVIDDTCILPIQRVVVLLKFSKKEANKESEAYLECLTQGNYGDGYKEQQSDFVLFVTGMEERNLCHSMITANKEATLFKDDYLLQERY